VERYQVNLLILLSYCDYVPSSTITNIPFYYKSVQPTPVYIFEPTYYLTPNGLIGRDLENPASLRSRYETLLRPVFIFLSHDLKAHMALGANRNEIKILIYGLGEGAADQSDGRSSRF
jgi:hypothetical protein